MSDLEQREITILLRDMQQGDQGARASLTALVYPELKKIASQYMRRERKDHTLQPSALVNEAFVKMAGVGEVAWRGRNHFFAVAAQLMRQILVDHARRHKAAKRGGGVEMLELQDWLMQVDLKPELILEIDRLLTRLEQLDERQARVVELRFFTGLTEVEVAEMLGISHRTVKREWDMARAWMRKELSSS